jgi:hypothetical protein
VFAAGALTGWVIPWWVRTWRASTVLIAETKAAAADVPANPTDAEWDRIVRAYQEDGL